MSNVFQSIASGVWNLKIWYQGPLKDQFNEDCVVYKMADEGKYPWSGLQVNRPLRVRRNQGVGATSDNGPLPEIGVQTGVQAVINAKFNYLRFGITGPMIKSSQNDKGSFVRQAAYELEMGYKDLMSDCNRQNTWDGSGTLATFSTAAVASTSVTLAGRESTEPALKFIDVGAVLDVVSASTGLVIQSGVQVNSITSGGPLSLTATLVFSAPITASAGDKLIRSNSLNNEVQGLLTQLDGNTTTVFSVARASYPSTQGNVIDLGGGQLTLQALQQAWQYAKQRGGQKFKYIVSDYNSITFYTKLLQPDKRFTNTNVGDGGFGDKNEMTLEYNAIPWKVDKDCPLRIFFLAEDAIEKYELAPMDFADEQGTMMIAQIGTDAYEVRVRNFYNLFNSQASACSVVRNYVSP